jgi:hypothetical protein
MNIQSMYHRYIPGKHKQNIVDLAPDCHAHGHHGMKIGLERSSDGLWIQDGNVVAFAHAL